MTHVVADPCYHCRYTDCVVVCPCECFHEGESMLFIDPNECIDCEAWKGYRELNAELAPLSPGICEKKT